MAQHSVSDPLEPAFEQHVRAAFKEHAPEHVEVDRAWAVVAGRLTFGAESTLRTTTASAWWARSSGRRRPGWRAMLVATVAVLALPVLLMGAGFLRERLSALDPGMQRIIDEHLYQSIGQNQTVDGITITLTAAYADEGRTVFFYRVAMSPALAQRYESAAIGSWSLTDEQGNESTVAPPATGGVGICSAWQSEARSQDCYMVQGPFHPAASATQISLALDITRVYLIGPGSAHVQITGDWQFQSNVPFHHMNVGSVEQFFPHLLHLVPGGQQP